MKYIQITTFIIAVFFFGKFFYHYIPFTKEIEVVEKCESFFEDDKIFFCPGNQQLSSATVTLGEITYYFCNSVKDSAYAYCYYKKPITYYK